MTGAQRAAEAGDGRGPQSHRRALTGPSAVVVGGGLAGITAALDLAGAGWSVTLVERRRRLGGLTSSFAHQGRQVDNGQHVFLRCCHDYLGFLQRIGSAGDVTIQRRLDVAAVAPGPAGGPPVAGALRRVDLPAPLHLGPALARYPHLSARDRLRAVAAVLALRRLDLADPALDRETFGAWLARHGQSRAAVAALWDLITVATVNLPAAEASLAVGAMVFKTGLLTDASAADIGWSRVSLGRLHGERAALALRDAGVAVRLGEAVSAVEPAGAGWAVELGAGERAAADAVVVAVPHTAAGALLPPGSVAGQDRLAELGTSAIVNVHVVYDRPVTDLPFFAAVGSGPPPDSREAPPPSRGEGPGTPPNSGEGPGTPRNSSLVHWVFDRTASSGHTGPGQYLAVTISAADRLLGRHPDTIAAEVVAELGRLLPAAAGAGVVDALVTKERAATFRATPGTAALRPSPATGHAGLAVAGAWTDTGWPATMEGAVRSGHAAASSILGRAAPRLHDSRLTEEVA